MIVSAALAHRAKIRASIAAENMPPASAALSVKVHPGIAASVMRVDSDTPRGTKARPGPRRQYVTGYLLFVLGKAANVTGDGWVSVDGLRAFCAEHIGMIDRTFYRYLSDALAAGFIERRGESPMLRLRSVEHVARLLNCERIGWPVSVPVCERHTGSIAKWRASLLAAWHAARSADTPIRQSTVARITGIKPRRQHEYNRRAGVKVRRNYAESQTDAKHIGGVRLRYPHAFARDGAIVIPLPNSYRSPVNRCAHRGIARNIDRVLSQPVLMSCTSASPQSGASCNPHRRKSMGPGSKRGDTRSLRAYFRDDRSAKRAAQRNDDNRLRFYAGVAVRTSRGAERVESTTRDGSLLWGVVGHVWG